MLVWSQLMGARLHWVKCKPAVPGARAIKISADFGGSASLLSIGDLCRSRFPFHWPILWESRKCSSWASARRYCTPLASWLEKWKYLFWQGGQGLQRERARTSSKLSSSLLVTAGMTESLGRITVPITRKHLHQKQQGYSRFMPVFPGDYYVFQSSVRMITAMPLSL